MPFAEKISVRLHCQQIAPKYSELAAAFPHAHFLRVDVDKQPAIAAKYKISAMPTFLAIIDGEVKGTVRLSACSQNLPDNDWKSYKVQIAKGSRNS